MKAIWNGVTVAESDDTVVFDGDHYFPAAALKREYFTFSNHRRTDPAKGMATYQSLMVGGDLKPDAVWSYAEPGEAAAAIQGRFAFGRGVQVVE